MKLSEKLREASEWEETHADAWWFEEMKKWADEAEYLESKLEGEGMYAERDRDRSVRMSEEIPK